MNYIDLNHFLDCIPRDNIVELVIEKNNNYIFVSAFYYDIKNNLIKIERSFKLNNSTNIQISPLNGLTQLERLKITNIDKLNVYVLVFILNVIDHYYLYLDKLSASLPLFALYCRYELNTKFFLLLLLMRLSFIFCFYS
jgi:hypothetical protein